jgi:hypothetical protein
MQGPEIVDSFEFRTVWRASIGGRMKEGQMTNLRVWHLALVAMIALTGCSQGSGTTATTTSSPGTPPATGEPSPTPTIQDIMELAPFARLERGTYLIDADQDPSTPLRVVYSIAAEGWSQWIGAAKFSGGGHVGVSITTVSNLVRHGCRDHSWADPPVGPSVDDLTTALADLAPFWVTSEPEDVTIYGYRGKYLELTVPGEGNDRSFAGCIDGKLKSWVAAIDTEPGDAFYGYNGEPGRTEEFWILDVDGTRLVIEANWSPASPREDVAEMRAILDSIRIEP